MTASYSVRPDPTICQLWEVYDVTTDKAILSGFSNSQCWREIDRLKNEAISRSEVVSDWVAKNAMRSET